MELLPRFFRDPSRVGRRRRTLAGTAAFLVACPFFLGVMGCFFLPVPIGDPEKSRVDPAMTGLWLANQGESVWVVALQPHDKRTWLVTWAVLESGGEAADITEPAPSGAAADSSGAQPPPPMATSPDAETATPASAQGNVDAAMKESSLDAEIVQLLTGDHHIAAINFYKGWLLRIKGTRLMVWQPMVQFTAEKGMQPEHWWVQRVVAVSDQQMDLDFINPDFGGLKQAQTRKEAERIIGANIKDPDLFYAGDTFGSAPDFVRIPQVHYDLVNARLKEVGITEIE